MSFTVLLFARARDLAGTSQAEFQLDEGATVDDLLEELVTRFPGLAGLRSTLLVAVNNDYVRSGTILPENAEIACFPPVSGG
ncbi:MAG: molybdopterin converting factor subunit 1 [Planctomycetes bacterium]|nr:molybdopterin converting factor subunit 1 [Planctomycetota bacterium]